MIMTVRVVALRIPSCITRERIRVVEILHDYTV